MYNNKIPYCNPDMGKDYELNRADPNCPICNRLKDKHTPKEAQICFSKIRKYQE